MLYEMGATWTSADEMVSQKGGHVFLNIFWLPVIVYQIVSGTSILIGFGVFHLSHE